VCLCAIRGCVCGIVSIGVWRLKFIGCDDTNVNLNQRLFELSSVQGLNNYQLCKEHLRLRTENKQKKLFIILGDSLSLIPMAG
jgi:hypothetical protein